MKNYIVFNLQLFAYTDTEDSNYLGELYIIGHTKTPFLSMIGGMTGGRTYASFNFPVAQPYVLSAASQAIISEATSTTKGTPTTVTRAQDYNVCQIMKKEVEVSFAKQSRTAEFGGIQVLGNQPVQDEVSFQKEAQLRQLANDIEYSFLQGSYVAWSAANVASSTRGIIAATTTNAVAAASATLSKSLIDQILATMFATGSPFINPVIFCNIFQKQKISDTYGYAPDDRNIGGVNIKQIETDIGSMGIVLDPHMPTDTVLIAEMSVCYPVFCPYRGQALLWKDFSEDASLEGGFWYTQVGLDYGPEEYHGKITGLATS